MVAPLEVGICCSNIDLLIPFYVDAIGCQIVSAIEVPAAKAEEAALSCTAYRVVRLQTAFGERLKLLQPKQPPQQQAPSAWILDRRNATYLTFIVDDLNRVVQHLSSVGAELLTGPRAVVVRPGVRLSFAKDPEGNVLEFVQYDDVATYREIPSGGTSTA